MGAVGFELLKLLLGGYMQGVAPKSMYGAFGVPIALLLWINFMAKLLLFCAAWTATERTRKPSSEIDAWAAERPSRGVERAAPARARTRAGVSRASGQPPDQVRPGSPESEAERLCLIAEAASGVAEPEPTSRAGRTEDGRSGQVPHRPAR